MVKRLMFLTLALAATAFADTVWCCGGIIAQIVDGGPWKTTITLVNFEDGQSTYTLRFYDDSGQPMFLPTDQGVVSSIAGTLAQNATLVIETQGIQPGTQQGWAYVDTLDHIGGFGLFRLATANSPIVEVASPVVTGGDNTYKFPFDHVGSSTGVAVSNPNSASITVVVILRDQAGVQIGVDAFQMAAHSHTTFMLDARYIVTAGKRGSFEISTTANELGALGLRSTNTQNTLTLTSLTPQSPL